MRVLMALGCVAGLLIAGCPQQAANQTNPFMTAAETYGASGTGGGEESGSQAGGESTEQVFRTAMTLTLANTSSTHQLAVRMVAWVNASSIRSANQQDELLAAGYVQLTEEVRLGSAYTLPPGTFVYNGAGEAGSTLVIIEPGTVSNENTGEVEAATREFTFLTPDAILLFLEPPVGCDSVGFRFLSDGYSPDEGFNERATDSGSRKTLAQYDVYQCDPFAPGLFLKNTGGARQANEYMEGESVRVEFSEVPDASGAAAKVTIGSTEDTGTTP